MDKRIGRCNIKLSSGIKKFNVYINDFGTRFIYFEGKYMSIVKSKPYRGGWLWEIWRGN